jgi:hypothetical protein
MSTSRECAGKKGSTAAACSGRKSPGSFGMERFSGLVEKGTGRTVCLPFVTRPLYDALAKRLRRCPEQERVLFPSCLG